MPKLARLLVICIGGFAISFSLVYAWRDADSATRRASVSQQFWSAFRNSGVEATHFDSLDDMKRGSDSVLVGTIRSVELSRQWVAMPDWGEDGIASYVLLHVRPSKSISGHPAELPDGTVGVELFVASSTAAGELLEAEVPAERILLFLKPKRDVDGLQRLASSQGYIRDLNGAAAPEGAEDEWLARLDGQPFDDIVATVSRP